MRQSKAKLDQRMLHTFCHFDKRLKSRYGFKITYSEYLKLCDTPILLLYKVSRHRRFGILNIRGKEVWVIKSNLTKKLVTCLSRKSYLPVPRTYRKNGITDNQFQDDIRSAIITCQTIKNYVIESKMTCEQMFLERPFNMPSWVYSVVYSLITGRKNSHIVNNAVNILVMNLYEQKQYYRKPKKI
jgi:hypothetical protein